MNIECDRCKKIYEAREDTTINYSRDVTEIHLCPECSKLLRQFVREKDLEWEDDEDFKMVSESPLVVIVNPKYKLDPLSVYFDLDYEYDGKGDT